MTMLRQPMMTGWTEVLDLQFPLIPPESQLQIWDLENSGESHLLSTYSWEIKGFDTP